MLHVIICIFCVSLITTPNIDVIMGAMVSQITCVSVVCSSVCSGADQRKHYSIHVPGWLQKWLNLITAPGSVSNEPGSVTWLATKYLKTVSWRNHTEKLTTWWPQNISFWPKINIPSSYFTILMLNCLENTLKLQFDSYVTAVRFLTWSISKQPQSDLTFQHCWNQFRF